jgi:predicted RNA-binding Zn ribbon-like protein
MGAMGTSSGRRAAGALLVAPQHSLCLDFANTLAWRGSSREESLHELADVVRWCAGSGTVIAGGFESAVAAVRDDLARAARLFDETIAIRETIYRVFHAVAAGAQPAADDLAALNRELARAPARVALGRAGAGFGWRLELARPAAPVLLAPVLWSAGDLLASSQLKRVRECANGKCLWLFIDDSKNGSRRWCSMQACGNRAKAHRHYLRHKGG